ncbi:MAG: hypothetical protein U1E63_07870 [Burkholderiales bacterium]
MLEERPAVHPWLALDRLTLADIACYPMRRSPRKGTSGWSRTLRYLPGWSALPRCRAMRRCRARAEASRRPAFSAPAVAMCCWASFVPVAPSTTCAFPR